MTLRQTFLASAALLIAAPALAADPELTVFDWAGWEFDGILTDYVAKHGQHPTYAFYGDDDEAFRRSRRGSRPMSPIPAPPMWAAIAKPG